MPKSAKQKAKKKTYTKRTKETLFSWWGKPLNKWRGKELFGLVCTLIIGFLLVEIIVSFLGFTPASVWVPTQAQWYLSGVLLDATGIPYGPYSQYFGALSLNTGYFAGPLSWLFMRIQGLSDQQFTNYFLICLAFGA